MIIEQRISINNIPCLSLKPEPAQEKNTAILLYHGWGSCKENQQFLGKLLTFYGYEVIIPDCVYHGERERPFINFFDPKTMQAYFWEVIIKTVKESKKLIDNLSCLSKDHKLVVAGSSMGGCIAAGIFAQSYKVEGLINLIGSCAWEESEIIFRKRDGRPKLNGDERKKIREFDPIHRIDHEKKRPILLLHGANDPIIPIDEQRIYYEQAISIYGKEASNVEFQSFPGVTHVITIGMAEYMIKWLNEHFKGT
ncbi:dienelactone hydrolase family protein [Fictibacillus sp. Mic-4]|uniref:dienelactone hydrolase family protein n=1 Tax=Fictibacillus TaxID=1329200 RepID=UPI00040B06A1|nr:dienelactone hydrolase family protein [Fictibacillus gelatini]